MFENKNLTNNALQNAIYDRLCSMVYSALNAALDSEPDPEEQLKEWRELGADAFAHVVALSASPECASYPRAFRMNPWIAQHLRPYTADGLARIVQQWLEGKPLAANISKYPEQEDLKVKRLERFLSTVNGRA